jgi:general secretion pathway protein E
MHQERLIPYSYARNHGIIALTNPSDPTFIQVFHLPQTPNQILLEIQRFLDTDKLEFHCIQEEIFSQKLSNFYQDQSTLTGHQDWLGEELELNSLAKDIPKHQDLLDSQNDAPIIKLINALFMQAVKEKASDIHIETYESRIVVRFRVDGILNEILSLDPNVAPLVITRIKVMAHLDIAEKRLPQDGRISLRVAKHHIDVRVSTLPANHGERVVMRILDKQAQQLNLSLLGMPPQLLQQIEHIISQPHGILLVTGPTGSGKTTSLYAMLSRMDTDTLNILTIEDPIEFDLPGISQTQTNSKIDMTFAKGLRAILRQDPDVVMIGEIRDLETAEIAIQASLTGHLVFSTLHTNHALGAISRLQDMGVEPFLLSTSLLGVLAQRLLRKLCPNCKTSHTIEAKSLTWLEHPSDETYTIYQPKGCEQCHFSGYKGRMGIFEFIICDDHLKAMIHRQDNPQNMEMYIRQSTPSIRHDGWAQVLAGHTSINELLRVTSDY